ncbi:MAG: UDP-N-acetylglucosamine diphosphorylase/glucosamine-1-phosphate N-acetyltransferase [Paraglaciecola sp.]|jgi:UDP-N-acetylglucosamine diphosphorylase/glucosamine-1-phosphate N-acetyltransferase
MENIILFDNDARERLLPLTFTRPICELRVGILTIREKWEKWLKGTASFITQDYLSEKYDIVVSENNLIINGAVMPSKELCILINQMEDNEALLHHGELIVAKVDKKQFERLMTEDDLEELAGFELGDIPFLKIDSLPDIFVHNEAAIKADFDLLTKGRKSQPISKTNQVLNPENIFLEKGATVEFAILNASKGPIYVGKDAEIMEGAMIRGAFALGDNSVVKMGAKIYGATSTGPYCKLGGEVGNSVLLGYSNKGHDGYLGNSVLGEWCNLGADTNTSNLKNNYEEVKLWSYQKEGFVKTGQQFCGLIMGDHSKCGINTMFNTGTVVGISANVFGDGFPRNFIPSFSWGGASGYSTYRTDKAFETAEKVMARRKQELTAMDRVIMLKVSEETAQFRRWEKKKKV